MALWWYRPCYLLSLLPVIKAKLAGGVVIGHKICQLRVNTYTYRCYLAGNSKSFSPLTGGPWSIWAVQRWTRTEGSIVCEAGAPQRQRRHYRLYTAAITAPQHSSTAAVRCPGPVRPCEGRLTAGFCVIVASAALRHRPGRFQVRSLVTGRRWRRFYRLVMDCRPGCRLDPAGRRHSSNRAGSAAGIRDPQGHQGSSGGHQGSEGFSDR